MKKIAILFCFITFAYSISYAQFSASGKCVKASQTSVTLLGIDEAFVYFDLKPTDELTYSFASPTIYTWYEYDLLTPPSIASFLMSATGTTANLSSLEHGKGYILEFNGTKKYVWVYDEQDDLVSVEKFTISESLFPCETALVEVKIWKITPFSYLNSSGALQKINRKIFIEYDDLVWNGEAYENKTVTVEKSNLVNGVNQVSFDAPLKDTQFTLITDQFLLALDTARHYQPFPFELYYSKRVEQHIAGTVSEEDVKNRTEKAIVVTNPSTGNLSSLSGSAPLIVDFKSNGNLPVAKYAHWFIYNNADPTKVAVYPDLNFRYTFKDGGVYTARLRVSNDYCFTFDSASVKVSESFLVAPNVFTPNGDGIQDEFRVAYKSLISFHCVVYNIWGRKVYEWTDPAKGWDGRIGRQMAKPGAYFYVIEALGSDLNANGKRREYKLKGDINLLR